MLAAMPTHRALPQTELHRAVKRIAPFSRAFDLLREHVVITDSDAHVRYANAAAEQATGFSLHDMLGKNPADLWGGHMSKDFYARMWQRIKHERLPFAGDVRNVRKDGEESWQELRISPVVDTRGKILFFVAVESVVTERKKRERTREEMASVLLTLSYD
jgi:PAS domain S-box-containing protein